MSVRADTLELVAEAAALASSSSDPAEALVYELRALRLTITAAISKDNGDREPFEQWADVELMGHRQRTACVREIEVGHRTFLELTSFPNLNECARCGVHHRGVAGRNGCEDFVESDEMTVEIYSPSAVFCMTPLGGEEQAREHARRESLEDAF